MIDYLNDYKLQLSEDSIKRLSENPLRILDSKNPVDQRILINAPNVLDIKNESPSTMEMYGIGQKETNDFDASTNEYSLLNSNLTNDFTTNRFTNRLGLFFNLKFFKHKLKIGAYQRNVSIDNIDINDSTIKQNIFNFLPQFNYNYKFSNSQRLRLSYKTNSAQPSINQLQPVQDNTNPNRITIGNNELIPTYSHNFRLIHGTLMLILCSCQPIIT